MQTKHKFHTAKGDGSDSTFVKPSDWNDTHNVVTDGASVWLGRDASAPGSVQEFTVDNAGAGDDFSMYTKAQVDAAIATAVSNITVGETGDLCASMRGGKVGWLLLNGDTIGNAGSTAVYANALALNLFTLMWNINGGTWPILNAAGAVVARGASPTADWAALRKIALPDARGCAIGMLDLAAGLVPALAQLGIKVGEANHTLTPHEVPAPTLTPPSTVTLTPTGAAFASAAFGGGANLYNSALITTNFDGFPHNNVQPTMGANIFVKL